ncbi:MAG: PQQ-binding-like beta-propeller repeat protein [Phycisphaerae bacterium]|nr:PQQ-binding-like beta-propeller repeat protein [Phycisphaerae bacterium]
MVKRWIRAASAGILTVAAIASVIGDQPTTRPGSDWSMWGGSPSRNAVSSEKNIPHQWNLDTRKNIKWQAPLGTYSYGGPVIADGLLYAVDLNGYLSCFDVRTGRRHWRHDLEAGV